MGGVLLAALKLRLRMLRACKYGEHMKMLQIRNVPEDLHRRLKARAAIEGTSLSEYALGELRRAMERPTRTELLERISRRALTVADESSAAAVRAERDAR